LDRLRLNREDPSRPDQYFVDIGGSLGIVHTKKQPVETTSSTLPNARSSILAQPQVSTACAQSAVANDAGVHGYGEGNPPGKIHGLVVSFMWTATIQGRP